MESILELPPNRVRRNYQGGAELDRLEGRTDAKDGDRPEDWIGSTTLARNPGLPPIADEGLACVKLRDGTSVVLKDLINTLPEYFLGGAHLKTKGTDLGFLVKFIDSSMRLHVQAHPTAQFAQKYLQSRYGKLEAYVVLGARDPDRGYIRLGFQRSPSKEEWRRIVTDQDIRAMDACFDPVKVNPGEVWLVPGGLAHALGEGLLVIEILEPSDWVFRCEFERQGIVLPPQARYLANSPDLSYEMMRYESLSVEEIREKYQLKAGTLIQNNDLSHELLIGPQHTDCFRVERATFHGSTELEKPEVIQMGIVVDGEGIISNGDTRIPVRKASRLLIPAATRKFRAEPIHGKPLTIVLCSPGAA